MDYSFLTIDQKKMACLLRLLYTSGIVGILIKMNLERWDGIKLPNYMKYSLYCF